MGSSHEKKHKHHKHSSHKHKKHHHKKHHHKHKKEKKSKRETDVKESDVASMDEEALLRQALMTKESAMLEAVPSDDDSDSSTTDAATGQISSDHSKNITQSVNEGNSVTAGATRVPASTSNTNTLNITTASTGSTNTVNTAASTGSTNEVDKPEAPATNTNVKEGLSGDPDTAKNDNDISERGEADEGAESQHDVSIKESPSSRGRSGKRSHRNRSRERNRSRSREARDSKRRRSRSHSRSGKRVESQQKKGSKSRRSRSRSVSKSRSRRRSRTRSRTRRQGRSRSRRRHRSRSRSGNRSRRDRSRSWSRRRRNRSRRSRSRSKSGSRYSSPRSSKEKEENPYASYPIPVIKTKADIIAEFTAFCRDLSHNERENAAAVDVEQYHPFELSNEKEETNKAAAATSATQVVVDVNSGYDIRPVEMRFPVSSGLTHQNDTNINGQEQQQQSLLTNPNMSVAEIMSERALIQQRLLINPADTAAAMLLKELDNKMSRWCQGQTVPGRYTGITEVTPLDKSVHKMGVQAWAKKKMFYGLRPVREGFGMKLMKRMGWREGEPLGKAKEGHVEPIPVDVKTDRQGLSTEEDKVASVVSSTTVPASDQTPTCLQGKHPVCALQELCSKKQWDPPSYDIVSETGPQHMRTFAYKVKVNGEYYQPSCGTSNKKLAKAQAALTCLKSLGLIANK